MSIISEQNHFAISGSSLHDIVGPISVPSVGPTMSWSELPDVAKWFCSLMMLIGRLEIFSVLVIFTPAFWREN